MKKKLFGITIVAAIALMGGWNFSQSNNDVKLLDITLNNIEALASCEKTGGSCWMDANWVCCDAGNSGCSPCGN